MCAPACVFVFASVYVGVRSCVYNSDTENTSVKVQCEWLDKYLTTTG